MLLEAKSALVHGEFQTMVGETLPFAPRTAQMLMAIGLDRRITNAKFTSLLPPSWYALYQLTKLDDDEFNAALADGTIRPDLNRSDIRARLRKLKPASDEESVPRVSRSGD